VTVAARKACLDQLLPLSPTAVARLELNRSLLTTRSTRSAWLEFVYRAGTFDHGQRDFPSPTARFRGTCQQRAFYGHMDAAKPLLNAWPLALRGDFESASGSPIVTGEVEDRRSL
jgi:hypothetical protein